MGGRKKTSQFVQSRGEFTTQGITIKEWQRTPKQLLMEFCQGNKRPKPIYHIANGDKNGAFRSRVVLPDPKGKSEKDIVICTSESYGTQQESEHASALLALHYVDGERQHEKRLPEPFRTAWLALSGRSDDVSASQQTNTNTNPVHTCEFCQKEFKKEHGLTIHLKREHTADIAKKLAEEDAHAETTKEVEDAGFDLYNNDSSTSEATPPNAPARDNQADAFSITARGKFATQFDKRMFNEAKNEKIRAQKKKTDGFKNSSPYAAVMMSETNRTYVEEVIRHFRKDIPTYVDEITPDQEADALALENVGFRKQDIYAAISSSRDKTYKILLDWLCLNVDEEFLPQQFNARGRQMEVVPSVRRNVSGCIGGSAIALGKAIKMDGPFEDASLTEKHWVGWLLGAFTEIYASYIDPESSWPVMDDSSAERMEELGQMREDEIIALESILEDTNSIVATNSFFTHNDGHVIDLYTLRLGTIGSVPGESTVTILVVSASTSWSIYPDQPALVLFYNPSVSDAVMMQMTLELCKVAANHVGMPLVYEIWETTKTMLPDVFKNPIKTTKVKAASVGVDTMSASHLLQASKANPPKTLDERKSKTSSRMRTKPDNSEALLQEQNEKRASNKAYQDMVKARAKLPAHKFKEELLDSVQANQTVIISGETGCGKTTQVPQFLLDDAIERGVGGQVDILCTQPRRLAAIGVAARVSDERCDHALGGTVGYQIRLENKTSDKTRLTFMTTGILLRRLQADPLLNGVTHVIVDEVHERNVDTDFLLAILQSILTKRPELKIILMSATLNAELFSEYFSTKAILKIPGFTYPVKDHYLDHIVELLNVPLPSTKADDDREEENRRQGLRELETHTNYGLVGDLVKHIHETTPCNGSILVFMSGVIEINKTVSAIQQKCSSLLVLPLHAGLTGPEQSKVFNRPPANTRKVVVSTNVAETSITIDDIVYVIDAGRVKEMQYDPINHLSALVETWVSRDSARQRRGRAGRVQSGICYKMYTAHRHDHQLDQSQVPEIQRIPLESLVLQVLGIGLGEPATFLGRLVSPPSSDSIIEASTILRDIGAITTMKTNHTELTPLGRHMAKLPMDVRISKMLIYGSLLHCSDQVLTIAAALSTRNFFRCPNDKREEANRMKVELLGDVSVTQSDHICLLYAYERWNAIGSSTEKRQFAERYFLSTQALFEVRDLKRDFRRALEDIGFDAYASAAHDENGTFVLTRESVTLVKAAICAGLYPNLVNVIRPNQKYAKTAGGAFAVAPEAKELRMMIHTDGSDTKNQRIFLHPSSVNFNQREYPSPWLIYREKVQTSKVFVRECSAISPYGILLFGGDIEVHHEDGIVSVDQWIRFKSQARCGVLIRELRHCLDELFLLKIAEPTVDISRTDVILAIKNLITGGGF